MGHILRRYSATGRNSVASFALLESWIPALARMTGVGWYAGNVADETAAAGLRRTALRVFRVIPSVVIGGCNGLTILLSSA